MYLIWPLLTRRAESSSIELSKTRSPQNHPVDLAGVGFSSRTSTRPTTAAIRVPA